MIIGIDVTPLQGPHRMRGVGSVVINFLNNLPKSACENNRFVLYAYDDETKDDLEDIVNLGRIPHEFKIIKKPPEVFLAKAARKFKFQPRIANMINNNLGIISEWAFGDSRIRSKQAVDYFIQFDQNRPLPAKSRCKSALILYDLIPYMLENDYLWSYKTARNNGCSVKGAVRRKWLRYIYIHTLKKNSKIANSICCISTCTKNDFAKLLKINPDRMTVTLLGVNKPSKTDTSKSLKLTRYHGTGWGDLPKEMTLDSAAKFLFFAGGVDPRRKLVDLVSAFNNLRAQGIGIKLILAGDTMLGPNEVPNPDLQKYLKNTSYLDDIYFVGFVTDNQLNWLYKHALAFVYPSVYEGFGLPVLEAMQYGTPVITYKNSSITEVAGNAAIYADGFLGIADSVKELAASPKVVEGYRRLGQKRAAKFTWDSTTREILSSIGASI